MKQMIIFAAVSAFALSGPAFAEEGTKLMDDAAALACIQKKLPASSYVTNDLIPQGDNPMPEGPLASPVKLKVGLPWVLNDENAPFYNAIEQGFFRDEGIEVELVPGGPGKNHLQTLAGGAVDVAVLAGGQLVAPALTSPTPITGVKVVGSLLKGAPAMFITIDKDLQGRKLTPEDLKGRVVAGPPFTRFFPIMFDRAGIKPDEVKIVNAGPDPSVLYAGAADFYLGWVFNQPRDIEAKGYAWNGFMWRDYAFDAYTDVIIMRDDMLSDPARQDVAKRFMRATYRGTQYLLDHAEQSAETAVKYSADAPNMKKEDALFRFSRQEFLVRGEKGERLLATDEGFWDRNNAMLLQYGYMPTIKCD